MFDLMYTFIHDYVPEKKKEKKKRERERKYNSSKFIPKFGIVMHIE